jgi:hypothetical protein
MVASLACGDVCPVGKKTSVHHADGITYASKAQGAIGPVESEPPWLHCCWYRYCRCCGSTAQQLQPPLLPLLPPSVPLLLLLLLLVCDIT